MVTGRVNVNVDWAFRIDFFVLQKLHPGSGIAAVTVESKNHFVFNVELVDNFLKFNSSIFKTPVTSVLGSMTCIIYADQFLTLFAGLSILSD